MGRASIEKEEFWGFVISEQSDSGLSVREFCRREEVSQASFYQWRKKLTPSNPVDREVALSEPASLGFLPVNVVPSTPGEVGAQDKLDSSTGRLVGSRFESAVLQIVTPDGYSINISHASTSDLIVQTLTTIEQLRREAESC